MNEFVYDYLKKTYNEISEKVGVQRQCLYSNRKLGLSIKTFEKILNAYNMDYDIIIKPKY